MAVQVVVLEQVLLLLLKLSLLLDEKAAEGYMLCLIVPFESLEVRVVMGEKATVLCRPLHVFDRPVQIQDVKYKAS